MSALVKVPPIGEARDRELLRHAVTYAYRETGGDPLHAHFFFPADFRPEDRRPVVVFFHGGFWDTQMRAQFIPHCNHFASRGAIAVAAETRLASTHRTGPLEAIDDARSLLLWIKQYAGRLGIDAARVVAAGAAGGALLALEAAMAVEPPPAGGPDPRPCALILFSPLVDTTPRGGHGHRFPDAATAKRLSPSRLVRKNLPPAILFHGKADRIIPFDASARFARAMRRKRNTCELVDFERAEHPFFNFNVSELHFELTLAAADRFLVEQQVLAAAPDVDAP